MGKLEDLYVAASTEVLDQFYPKGDPRRGEFMRDIAVLFAELEPKLKQLVVGIVENSRAIYLTIDRVSAKDYGDDVARHWDSLRKMIIRDIEEL